MSIFEITTRVSHKWLERKTKHELASIIMNNIDRIDLFAADRRSESARVRIKESWMNAGRFATQLGPPVFVEQLWTPVLWDGDDVPDFFKTAGLESISDSPSKPSTAHVS
jgi:hypothetical protein